MFQRLPKEIMGQIMNNIDTVDDFCRLARVNKFLYVHMKLSEKEWSTKYLSEENDYIPEERSYLWAVKIKTPVQQKISSAFLSKVMSSVFPTTSMGKKITKQGKYTHVYTGEFFGDSYHGIGQEIVSRTVNKVDRYGGEWKNGKKDGFGCLLYSDGNFYAGEWKNGKREGDGRQEYSNGYAYDGDWKNDKKNGQGTFYVGEYIYEGEWKENVLQVGGVYIHEKNVYLIENPTNIGWGKFD